MRTHKCNAFYGPQLFDPGPNVLHGIESGGAPYPRTTSDHPRLLQTGAGIASQDGILKLIPTRFHELGNHASRVSTRHLNKFSSNPIDRDTRSSFCMSGCCASNWTESMADTDSELSTPEPRDWAVELRVIHFAVHSNILQVLTDEFGSRGF
jgi:hypothetical protein